MAQKNSVQKFITAAALWLGLGPGLAAGAFAGEVTVAVASNFLTTAQAVSSEFTADTGHSVQLVNGSTGTLYAQIIKGAPYDVFLSADRARIERLEQADRLQNDGRKTYALGVLVLYARKAEDLNADLAQSLNASDLRHFAMADPELAPYGRAAAQVLENMQLTHLIGEKAVLGANIGQTFTFIQTANAPIGFVALSQAKAGGGAMISIPDNLYSPVMQEAGLLKRSEGNPVARQFFDYLSADNARAIIGAAGYRLVP